MQKCATRIKMSDKFFDNLLVARLKCVSFLAVLIKVILILEVCAVTVSCQTPIVPGGERRQNLKEIIYCTFLKDGDARPPILSHVRVSRGPDSEENSEAGGGFEDGRGGSRFTRYSPSINFYPIKSPSYQHKMNQISQFHNAPHTASHITFSVSPLTSATYPVASLYAKGDSRRLAGDNMMPQSSANWESENVDEGDDMANPLPTLTPYIGSRVLSNIPKFFEHLQENIQAMRDSTEIPDDSVSVEHGFLDPASIERYVDMPTRRGDYFLSDGRLSVDTEREGGYRYSPINSEDDESGKRRGHSGEDNASDSTGEEASTDLLAYMGRDPKYKKANNYNPSWLFTNLGLGKRSFNFHHPVHQKQQARLVKRFWL